MKSHSPGAFRELVGEGERPAALLGIGRHGCGQRGGWLRCRRFVYGFVGEPYDPQLTILLRHAYLFLTVPN
ncbi:MAG: hypothetical protein ACC700_09060, partial [Anaerolineales bacterium]